MGTATTTARSLPRGLPHSGCPWCRSWLPCVMVQDVAAPDLVSCGHCTSYLGLLKRVDCSQCGMKVHTAHQCIIRCPHTKDSDA